MTRYAFVPGTELTSFDAATDELYFQSGISAASIAIVDVNSYLLISVTTFSATGGASITDCP